MTTARELADILGDIVDPSLRTITETAPSAYKPYDRYGAPIEGLSWIPLSIGNDDDLDVFLLRMEPGSHSRAHEHTQPEQFLVLAGSLIDCDDKVIPAGSYARFEAGSKHHSRTEEGCVLLVILRGRNRRLDEDGN